MKRWAWLLSAGCVVGGGLLLSGCGGTIAPKMAAPAIGALAGNWLLVGPMPTHVFDTTPTGTRLAVTFDVNGNNIVATGFGNNSCDNTGWSFGFGGAGSPTGTVAADGSFTLTTPPNYSLGTVSIKGMVPPASGELWQGSYAVSMSSPLTPKCDTNLSGTFTAIAFPLVNGVYVGTTNTKVIVNGVSTITPVTLQITLKQGGMVTDSTGKPFLSSSTLSGSIRVQGSPCFTSGVTDSTRPSGVVGNQVSTTFTMNDGSTMLFSGSLTDVTEAQLTASMVVTGGQCGTPLSIYLAPELDRQS